MIKSASQGLFESEYTGILLYFMSISRTNCRTWADGLKQYQAQAKESLSFKGKILPNLKHPYIDKQQMLALPGPPSEVCVVSSPLNTLNGIISRNGATYKTRSGPVRRILRSSSILERTNVTAQCNELAINNCSGLSMWSLSSISTHKHNVLLLSNLPRVPKKI